MLTKRAALSESPRGGLSRRPLSLSGLKARVSRGKSDELQYVNTVNMGVWTAGDTTGDAVYQSDHSPGTG